VKSPLRRLLIPNWLPVGERTRVDLSELTEADDRLGEECDRLGDLLGAHVAAYRTGATPRPTGLCSVFKYARLSVEQAAALVACEERHSGVILVAYERPLARW
jgi:hypothetical protein